MNFKLVFGAIFGLWLGLSSASAQNITCPTRPSGDSSNACASTAFVTAATIANFGSPPPLGNITPNTVAATTLTVTSRANIAGEPRSLQSFGAIGDGVANDTAAVETALNSGIPLVCRGTFKLESLVTITNKNVFLQGGSEGCTLVLNNNQTMIYATLSAASIYAVDHFTMKDVKISVNAAITSVTGPAQTAALYITYPTGTNGVTLPTVNIENVQVKPTADTNYIVNGIYLNDATYAEVRNILYEGRRSSIDPVSRAIIYDGTKNPAGFHLSIAYISFVGTGVYAPPQAATGWQGIRIKGVDCVYCGYPIDLNGASDGLSDHVDIEGTEGAFTTGGVRVTNALHVLIHDNYYFNLPAPVPGISNPLFPICYEIVWSIAIPANAVNSSISDNTCDGSQAVGFTGRYGVAVTGTSGTSTNVIIGPNILSNMEFGWALLSNTAGVTVYPQILKTVATAGQNNATVGANNIIQFPVAYIKYNTNAATSSTTLAAADISGGAADVVLNMTGALGANAVATLPTVGSLVSALPNPQIGQSYRLQIVNTSSNAFSWTVATNTGWTLNNGMAILQNVRRDFAITLTSMTAATLQSLGSVSIGATF